VYCSRQRQRAARARCWSSRNFSETFVSGRVRARLDPFLLCRNSSQPLPHTHVSQSTAAHLVVSLTRSFVVVSQTHSLRFVVSFSYSSSVLAPLSYDTRSPNKTYPLSKSNYLSSLRTWLQLFFIPALAGTTKRAQRVLGVLVIVQSLCSRSNRATSPIPRHVLIWYFFLN